MCHVAFEFTFKSIIIIKGGQLMQRIPFFQISLQILLLSYFCPSFPPLLIMINDGKRIEIPSDVQISSSSSAHSFLSSIILLLLIMR